MEGVYPTGDCVPMTIIGWTNPNTETTSGLQIPCMLSLLVGKSTSTQVEGLEQFPRDDWATNVNLVFQVYHLMINLGMAFIAIGVVASFMWWWKRKIWNARWLLWVLIVSIGLTELATLSGWWTAEFGRQPWIVWGVLQTNDAESPLVSAGQLWFSIGMFVVLYAVVFGVFLSLLNRIIKAGPPDPPDHETTQSLPDTFGEVFRRRSRVSIGGD
jgi:cytochrome d ubiquinol oxidase subunit I